MASFHLHEMDFLRFCLLSSLAMFTSVHDFGGAWSFAHATFYGGGDASGTMGKNQISPWILFQQINFFYCPSSRKYSTFDPNRLRKIVILL
ncbi:hypothetical protein U1Q18_048601 [Sarracenia purpurea var. burkii]